MTRVEWALIAGLVDGIWKDDFTDQREHSYYPLLAEYKAEHVYFAVIRLARKGGDWAPSGPALLAAVEGVVPQRIGPSYEASDLFPGGPFTLDERNEQMAERWQEFVGYCDEPTQVLHPATRERAQLGAGR